MKSSDHKTVASQFVTFVGLTFALALGFFVVNQGTYTAKGEGEMVLGSSVSITASSSAALGCFRSFGQTCGPYVKIKGKCVDGKVKCKTGLRCERSGRNPTFTCQHIKKTLQDYQTTLTPRPTSKALDPKPTSAPTGKPAPTKQPL